MNILAVDTSGPSVGVALLCGDRLVFECTLTHRRTHSQWVMPTVEQALAQTGHALDDVDLIASVVGPGSFTGVRIGVSTVKGLAQGLNKPCVAIDALEALAVGAQDAPGTLCPILDARAGQVYGAAFSAGLPPRRLLDDMAAKLEEYLAHIAALPAPFVFLGDGVAVFREALTVALGERARFAPPHACGLRAGCAAVLATQYADRAVGYAALRPLYLRAPQAERERAAREQAAREAAACAAHSQS